MNKNDLVKQIKFVLEFKTETNMLKVESIYNRYPKRLYI